MSLDRLREHRRLWERKPELRAVYAVWFERLLDGIAPGARVLEVGAGPGLLGEAARAARPDLRWTSSDLLVAPWNDVVADAGRLPLATGSVSIVVGLDVLHHLPRPAEFFREAARVLGGRGELRLVEPWITPLGWFVYRFLHQEDCRLGVDPWNPFPAAVKDSFDGDAAVPWRLVRNTPAWEWRHLGFEPPRRRRLNGFAYLLSLGFRERSLLPPRLVGTLVALDRHSSLLSPLVALRAVLVWEASRTAPRSTPPASDRPREASDRARRVTPEPQTRDGQERWPRRSLVLAGTVLALGALLAYVAVTARDRRGRHERWTFARLLGDPVGVLDQSRLYEDREVRRLAFRTRADVDSWRFGNGDPVAGVSGRGVRLTADQATRRLIGPLGEPAEAIDVIEIEVEQDQPSPVAVFWPRADDRFDADHVTAGTPGPDRIARLVVAAHPRWRGHVERIAIQPSFVAQTVVLRGIRFIAYGLSPERAAGAPADVRAVDLDGDSRPALAVVAGRPASVPADVPPRARLRFGLGLPDHVAASARFVLGVSGSGGPVETLLEERIDRSHGERGWSEHQVDLGAWAGRRIILSLRIEGGPEAAPIGFWSNPLLRLPAVDGRHRPNVILISADTLRADHLSFYGYPRPTSPLLGRWAEERGVVFRHTVAPSPWTVPSHVSLFTGYDAHRHGVSRQGPIPSEIPVVAALFRDAGYVTLASTGGGLVAARFGFDRGFDVFHSREATHPTDPRGELERGTDEILDWLTRHAEEPFFLFFHTYATHTPLEAMEPFFSRVRGRSGPLPGRPLNAEPVTPQESDGFRRRYRFVWTRPLPDGAAVEEVGPPAGEPALDLNDPQLAVDLYDAAIARLDAALARVLGRLDVLGLAGETIVVFTSDHGESLGENGFWAHTHLQDTNLLVPLVVAPRPPSGPRMVDRQVRLIDVAPTLFEMSGIPAPAGMQGRSLLPLLRGESTDHPEEAWAYAARTNWGLGLRVANRWKLVVPNTIWPALRGRDELYDLVADPAETTNVAGAAALFAALRALAARELEQIHQGVVVRARCERPPCFEGVLRGLGSERSAVTSADLGCACVEPVSGGTRLTLRPGEAFTIVYEDLVDGELDVALESTGSRSFRKHVRRSVGPGRAAFALRLDDVGWRLVEGASTAPAAGLHVSYEGSAREPRPEVSREMEERLRALGYIE